MRRLAFVWLHNRSTREAVAPLWLRATNMSKAFDSIKQGLQEAIAHARDDRSPQGPALVLLNVIDKNPAAVLTALQ